MSNKKKERNGGLDISDGQLELNFVKWSLHCFGENKREMSFQKHNKNDFFRHDTIPWISAFLARNFIFPEIDANMR